jgi:hypothetical protein
MEQTGVGDLEEFERIAQDLAERGFIDEGVNRYEFFVGTLRGIAAGPQRPQKPPQSREKPLQSREKPPRRSRRVRVMATYPQSLWTP